MNSYYKVYSLKAYFLIKANIKSLPYSGQLIYEIISEAKLK